MHEMSLALAVVEQVADAARARGIGAVRRVVLRVGELAGVVPDALAFCFELACEGTVLAGAELATEWLAGRARCRACGHDWATGLPPQLACPACDSADTVLLSGRELEIGSVHWAEPEAATAATAAIEEE
ncbi:hydrogenase maturation nickel metallochaperone HypA [Kitasatospora viridis]|uniref:Hydrogenase maturation factor HypA n=1 Tax=Kitasatospora viridis TaxID=281105 RepID=A0A561SDQ9_9ACTN|nr:hydrogenase maturation nickel metallochaperone HypA [Kitasatospora viridis]TWF73011.1 hydrogenase nickel incorporation protein HypA/HybF [Kitasatospora viridis]